MEGCRRSYDTQIVDGEGNYNVEAVKNFMSATNLSSHGRSYAVVAILGPQHGGKSTIMNHLFGTNFQQMDTFRRRTKTTDGIWIAKCAGIDDPFIIAMDVEGTDGKERGEDDTIFEKQSALFALANADVVMINMWCHDLGREHAANKPMLKVVFEVMMRMFSSPRKVTLLFVLRDKTQAEQFDNLKDDVEEEIEEIWDTAVKPHSDDIYDFRKYFRVEVVALSNYHDKKELFKKEVAQMRDRYFGSNLLDGNTLDRLPASEFVFSTQKIWNDIKQNKYLDIPTHRVVVETFRCKEIADDKFGRLSDDKGWLELKKAVRVGTVSGFGKKFRCILDTYLIQFDEEAKYFDEGIRNKQWQELLTKAVRELAYSSFLFLVANFRSKALEDLKNLFEDYSDKGIRFGVAIQTRLFVLDVVCKDAAMELVEWDTSDAKEDLLSYINRQLILLQDSKFSEFATVAKDKLERMLSTVIESSIKDGAEKMWELIRAFLVKDTELVVTEFAADIAHLGSSWAVIDLEMKSLRHHAKNVAERIVRKMAEDIQHHMKIRFERVFTFCDDGRERDWRKVERIDNLSLEARKESLKLLAAMAALRFSGKVDNIQNQLFSGLIYGSAKRTEVGGVMEFGPLACRKWAEVSSSDTLITPEECKRIWAEFFNKTVDTVGDANEKRREYESQMREYERVQNQIREYERQMRERVRRQENAIGGGAVATGVSAFAKGVNALATVAGVVTTIVGLTQ